MKTFLKILSLGKEYKYWMLLAGFLSFLTVGSGIGLMMTSSYLIAKAALLTPIYQLQVAIVGVRFFGISRGVFRYLERLISHNLTFRLLQKLRIWFFSSLIPIVPSKTIDLSSGDLLNRAVEDIENIEHIFVRVISPPFVFLASALLMFLLLLLFGLNYAFIFLVMYLFSAVSIPALTYFMSKKLGEEIIRLRTKLKELAVDGIQGISEIIFYGEKARWNSDFNSIHEKLIKAEKRMKNIQALHESLTGFAMNITVAVLLFTAIPDVETGILEGVYLAVITIGIMAAFEAVVSIPQAFQYLSLTTKSGERLFSIIDNQHDNSEADKKTQIDNYNLKFENVSFSYDNSREALSNISFELKKGEKTAIVGESGAGKSTLVNLITKLWNSEKGKITIGNAEYSDFNETKLREIISVVPQKVHLFTGTIKDNLLIAKPDATDEELSAAIRKAGLEEFINNLPEKLNTNIGELGKKLSGGESKRLTIARAFLKDHEIIIFDEALSHVDSLTESLILDSVKSIPRSKIVLFITHKLNRMEMFDKILVIRNGRLIETGTHKELLEQNTFYKRLFEKQNNK